uniref:AlNc14C287G10188 protein n=1 Tax=Albugo laibachii Nc14 TaxID=890382 RepID=F0WV45_9STRA|nr:AlNc14C287G10188 [Albugo laibachii Nc14]|eukprot:CCA25282.1 AlNc14C287G10188 [Albugo laibachii Nc14]
MSNPALPADFFENAPVSLRVSKPEIKPDDEAQMEQEFQEFRDTVVAQVEEEDALEVKERDALEQLDNMTYLNRYRDILEKTLKKEIILEESSVERMDEEPNHSKRDVESIAVAVYAKRKKKKIVTETVSDSSNLFNWRAKAL